MKHALLIKNVLEYFIDLDNIAKKKDEIHGANIDCIGLDLQFYFRERNEDIVKLSKELKQNKNRPSMLKIIEYFEWLTINFRKLVDESESNCNQWESDTSKIEQRRVEIDQILTDEENQLKIGNILS